MFNNKRESPPPSAYPSDLRVLKLDIKPEKIEQELAEWIEAGWDLESTEAVQVDGHTLYILAFLRRRLEVVWRDGGSL